MDEYQKQANDFAKKHGVTLKIISSEYGKHFGDTDTNRHIFTCVLSKGDKKYKFKFGQSIAAGSKEPTMYDVLSAMQKYDVGSFENFIGDFGYPVDTAKERAEAKRIYNAVCKEYEAMDAMFTSEELEEMQEIN